MANNSSVEKAVVNIKNVQHHVSCKQFVNIRDKKILVTTYLQMTDCSEFRPTYLHYLDGIKVMCMETPDVAFYRFLCSTIGKPWNWREILTSSDEEIYKLLASKETSVHVLYVDGSPAGYIELAKRQEGVTSRFYSTEIVYFGLRPDYRGRGLSSHLLSHGIAYAWNKGAQRLWTEICNLDCPCTLNHYIKRGFKVYRIDKKLMPEHSLLS
jgi:GNAT superfamily N-acetyltransferase